MQLQGEARRIAVGYEADIVIENEGDETRVCKRYRFDHPAMVWLEDRLRQWYEPSGGLAVAQHEWAAYDLLAPLGFVPQPIELRPDAIVLQWGGEPLRSRSRISLRSYESQSHEILNQLRAIEFRHNDLLARNVLVDGGQLCLIDFTMAEFGAVSFMADLPDPAWARPGQDEMLAGHLREMRPFRSRITPRRHGLVAERN